MAAIVEGQGLARVVDDRRAEVDELDLCESAQSQRRASEFSRANSATHLEVGRDDNVLILDVAMANAERA